MPLRIETRCKMRSMRGKIRWRRHRIREKFEEAWTMGWDTALTVSFTGSILISRDTSRLCNSCRQPSSITPGIPASVSSVRDGNHGLPARRGQTPGFRVCQPLLHDPKPSGGEPSVAVRPIFTSPRLATATTDRGLSGISKTGNRPTRLLLRYQQDSWFPTFLLRRRNFCLDDRNSALFG